jgi:hypothetical protein
MSKFRGSGDSTGMQNLGQVEDDSDEMQVDLIEEN